VDKEEDPKGDRVKITMSGKFLSYKKWWVRPKSTVRNFYSLPLLVFFLTKLNNWRQNFPCFCRQILG
jgi:hypothetical protein